jgi:hypothetical protein
VDERTLLRWRLLDRYAADPDFAAALRLLYETHVPASPELPRWHSLAADADYGPLTDAAGTDVVERSRYVAAVRELANEWGLDRLMAKEEERGARLLHDWCRARQRLGPQLPLGYLATLLTEAHYTPEIGEVVDRTVHDLGDVRVVDQMIRPVVRISITDEWNPEREPRSTARKRLRARADAAIREELDRLTADAEGKGYRFTDSSPALGRDIDRLFRLMTGRVGVETLVDEADDAKAEAGIVKSVTRVARRTGVSSRGWHLSRR